MPKDSGIRPALKLIDCEGSDAGAGVVRLDQFVERARDAKTLKAEARDFEARNGKNPYSDFILRHGRRPDPEHAATLGQLINIQVKASDGSLQPKLTKEDRAARRQLRNEQAAQRQSQRDANQLWCALRDLSEIRADPDQLLRILDGRPDIDRIRDRLKLALEYLDRFERGLARHESAGSDPSA